MAALHLMKLTFGLGWEHIYEQHQIPLNSCEYYSTLSYGGQFIYVY